MAYEILFISLGLGILMLSLFLVGSIRSLQYNECGLNYSSYFKSVENKTYYHGFHFIGLGHEFIPYKLNVATMDFSHDADSRMPPIDCRTSDGLNLNLEFSFQYRVIPSKIYDIYTTYGDSLETILLRMAIDSISEVSTEFTAFQFFSEKKNIQEKMKTRLDERLQKDVYVEVVFFQLKAIDLVDSYEDAIENTEVTKQSILRAEAERIKNRVVLETNTEVALISRNITLNQAQGVAEAMKLKAEADAETFYLIQQQQAEAYSELKANLTLDNKSLIEYLQVELIQNYPTGKLAVSIQNGRPTKTN